MNTIELINGYYIEIDDLNHTLKQRYIGIAKDGSQKEAVKTIGYYNTIRTTIDAFIKHNQIDCMAHTAVELKEYVKRIEEINNRAVKAIESVLWV